MVPVQYSLMSWHFLKPSQHYPDYIIKVSGIKIKEIEWNKKYDTYVLPVEISSSLRLPVLIAVKSISIGEILYEWGERSINGILSSLIRSIVILLWQYLAPSWRIIVNDHQSLSSLSSSLTSSLRYNIMIVESVFYWVRQAYTIP